MKSGVLSQPDMQCTSRPSLPSWMTVDIWNCLSEETVAAEYVHKLNLWAASDNTVLSVKNTQNCG
ncbi:hypothetical protein E2C01_068783 [Portunus trituberculatus]|uniref:Uncharacterized protein n=1 Tax=Portunus trituberculatus TaxID=210409 RepID=A0A5B7HX48_PORTR|nr:hypothetical protein [Portunus trituberculatus]